jgi:WD40 repeat protein
MQLAASSPSAGGVAGGSGPVASSAGTLAAVASAEPRIRLLDLRTCAFSHTLMGHTDAVMTVAWIPRCVGVWYRTASCIHTCRARFANSNLRCALSSARGR